MNRRTDPDPSLPPDQEPSPRADADTERAPDDAAVADPGTKDSVLENDRFALGADGRATRPDDHWIDRSAGGPDRESPARQPPAGNDDRETASIDPVDAIDSASSRLAEPVVGDEPAERARTPGLFGRLLRALRGARRSGFADVPYNADEHGPLATFETGSELEERDRYWVNFPYALVVVIADPATNDLTYRVVEPSLDPVERTLLSVLEDDVRDPLLYRAFDATATDEPEALLRRELDRRVAEYDVAVTPRRFERLFYYLRRSFLGYDRLDPLMCDPHIEDVSCDGYDLPLFVYHDAHGNVETTVEFGEEILDDFVIRLAQRSGRHVSLGRPVIEATLPDGSRAELALGTEVTPRGSAFTIRKYAEDPFTPLDLIETGTFSIEEIAYLWLCIEHDKNLLFAGGTASGKTTAMNAVSMFVPPRAKVLTIEDTRELSLFHDNWLSSVTRERSGANTDVTMYDLLRSALRHRPEYIIVGEVRGSEAMTLFQAMNTGHTTYSTMHANSVRTVINRLENEPINVPRQMVQSLDVLCVQGFANVGGERVRRNKELAEIDGIDERTGELDYATAFEWNPTEDGHADRGSEVVETIRETEGWSRTDLLRELKRRRTYLGDLREHGIDDYRRFTAAINAYYVDPERAVADVDAASRIAGDPPRRTGTEREKIDESTGGDAVAGSNPGSSERASFERPDS